MKKEIFSSPSEYSPGFLDSLKDNGSMRYDINLMPYLKEYSRANGSELTDNLSYQVWVAKGLGWTRIKGVGIEGVFRDAEFTLILFKDKIFKTSILSRILLKLKTSFRFYKISSAIACIGFEINQKDKEVTVKQIQGVKGREKELQAFRWEKMLLKIVTDWARANEIKKIRVISGKKNRYFTSNRSQLFYIRYDVTAKRSGFKFKPEENAYTLNLV